MLYKKTNKQKTSWSGIILHETLYTLQYLGPAIYFALHTFVGNL